jgi:predicted dehydrogenase
MGADAAVRIGLIGAGSMGALHARVIATYQRSQLAWVVDPDRERGEQLAERYGARWLPEADLQMADAVVVAAPTQFHHEISREVLAGGLPLLVEKPLTHSLQTSIELVEQARRCGGVLMCGLLERFNAAVRTAMEIARDPIHAMSVRHSPYASRIRTGVAEDLMLHDVDIVLELFGSEVVGVVGSCGVFDERSIPMSEDIVDATLRFENGRFASLSASRLSQRKVRSLTIAEMDRLIDVDLLRQDVTIYRHVGANEYDEEAGYRQQTIIDIPVLRNPGEPLQLQLRQFIALIDGDLDPAVELDRILPPHRVVVEVLAASRSASESLATEQ